MKMLNNLLTNCSSNVRLALVSADLIPQLINTLHPQSLSFVEAVGIHVHLMTRITNSLRLTTPDGFACLKIEDYVEEQSMEQPAGQRDKRGEGKKESEKNNLERTTEAEE
ncbi:hypothetical protein BLNAU_6927 [Blattamonas nauphoetae]|uniref:Uncharacterized protein n=1 Tax=Blattamonas nauphoetae TaxID=2049346 RepID=A0ABQ9Y2M8_9EUKA|nr:hypothetical protein BLNAU_6927 [Blattamonas nauphoetae]